MRDDVISKLLGDNLLSHAPTGSSWICAGIPGADAPGDSDTVVLVRSVVDCDARLGVETENGWQPDGSLNAEMIERDMGDSFRSYKKGLQNLIVTSSRSFYDKFVLATKVARALRLIRKVDRITLFQAILYENAWGAAEDTP